MRVLLLLVLLLCVPTLVSAQACTLSLDAACLGMWSASHPGYVAGQMVQFNGSVFLCNTACPQGFSPTSGFPWKSMAGALQWNPLTAYSPNQMVVRAGSLYTAITSSTGSNPPDNPALWQAQGIPSTPTLTTVKLTAGKFPAAIQLANAGPSGTPTNPTITFGSSGTDGNQPLIELIDFPPDSYSCCGGIGPGSSGFIIYGHPTTSPGQNNPISIFMNGYYNNGAGNVQSGLEIENKANWDGDGKPQLWFEIPHGTPTLRIRNSDGLRAGLSGNGQDAGGGVTSGIELTALVGGDHGTYHKHIIISDQGPSGLTIFPQLAGGGKRPLCVDNNGVLYAGSNSSTPCPP